MKNKTIFIVACLSLVGAFWFLYMLDYNMSVAVWVGIIALAGISAETGVVMLLYLDLAYEQWKRLGRMANRGDLMQSIHHGAVKRIRPKVMTITVITTPIAISNVGVRLKLIPILKPTSQPWSTKVS